MELCWSATGHGRRSIKVGKQMKQQAAVRVLVTTSSFAAQDKQSRHLLEEAGAVLSMNPFHQTLSEEQVRSLLRAHRPIGLVAGVEPLTSAVLNDAAGHLRVISRCGTGVDNLDLAAAAALQIAVYNTPEAPVQAVAELTLGLMLSLARGIPALDQALRAGTWKKQAGVLLSEWTIGIIGLGRIGKRVACLAQAFGSTVLAHDLKPDRVWAREHAIRICSKEQLLKQADLVTLHTAAIPTGAAPLIGAGQFKQMKAGSLLINTARGGLVDELALVEALRSGHLAGAAIDAFAREPYAGPLQGIDRVILTPHVGSAARAARVRMEREAAENLLIGLRRCGVLPRRIARTKNRRAAGSQ